MRNLIRASLATAIGLTTAIPSLASAATYLPTGPQTNVALATVSGGGWTQCYAATYATPLGTSAADELAGCSGSRIMYAARETGSNTLLLLAQALKVDVTFNTGVNASVTHNANGSEWYYADNWSVGFANGGDSVSKSECDTNAGPLRLCWHTVGGVGGYRIGNLTALNSSTAYEKLIFFANDVNGAVPEPATWAMMLAGFGIVGGAMRRRQRTSVSFA